jgi:hypothetical protein
MIFSLYNKFGALNSRPVFDAIAHGLQRHGHNVVYHDDSADVAVIWSQLWSGRMQPNKAVWDLYKTSNRPVLVAEVGAIQRDVTWRVMLDGKNQFITTGHTGTRSQQLGIQLLPWHGQGDEKLIALQHEASNQWAQQPPMVKWLEQTVHTLRQCTDRPIVIRPHPRCRIANIPYGCTLQTPSPVSNSYDDFNINAAVQKSWAVVNWNSNPAVSAILAGTPAFVGNSSIAAAVGNLNFDNIENPTRPDREQWVNDLAWNEWKIEELYSGAGLESLLFLTHRA